MRISDWSSDVCSSDLKDPQVALNAYCDAAGIGARMELNVLAHLNRLFDATFKLPNFAYRPIYNQMCDRVEARLVSLCNQRVQFPTLHTRLQLREGDVLGPYVLRDRKSVVEGECGYVRFDLGVC